MILFFASDGGLGSCTGIKSFDILYNEIFKIGILKIGLKVWIKHKNKIETFTTFFRICAINTGS